MHLFTALGLLVVGHAAFSTIHYKELAVATGQLDDVALPPLDAIVEAVAGFAITLMGVLVQAGSLKPVRSSTAMSDMTFDKLQRKHKADFDTYNHRGQALRARMAALSS